VLVYEHRIWGNRELSYDYGYDGGAFSVYAASNWTFRDNVTWDNRNVLETGTDAARTPCDGGSFVRNLNYGATTVDRTVGMVLRCASNTLVANNTFAGKFADASGLEHDLVDVVPVNKKNNTKDLEMELWADCGRSAHTVSGMDGGSGMGGGGSKAKYKKGGETKKGSGSDWMDASQTSARRIASRDSGMPTYSPRCGLSMLSCDCTTGHSPEKSICALAAPQPMMATKLAVASRSRPIVRIACPQRRSRFAARAIVMQFMVAAALGGSNGAAENRRARCCFL
jgi:hypothetical protein